MSDGLRARVMDLLHDTAGPFLVVSVIVGIGAAVIFLPDESQSGESVPADPQRTGEVGMTTYCLPDSRLRVFERPFPQGGTQPLFSVVNVDTERAGSPWRCPE